MEANPTPQPITAAIDPTVEVVTQSAPSTPATVAKTTPVQIVLIVLGTIAAIVPSTIKTICTGVVLATVAGVDGADCVTTSTVGSMAAVMGWGVGLASIFTCPFARDFLNANAVLSEFYGA